MRLFDDANSYATPENAERKLRKELAAFGHTLAGTRYLIAINSVGRYVPVVSMSGRNELVALAHRGICVTN